MKALIVYYSYSSHTKHLAEQIARETGGDLLELIPETPYPAEYRMVVEQAKQELQAGIHPALKTPVPDLSGYDTVFVGTPNWCGSAAPPLLTFLEKADLTGKRVAPFCTHGGGGSGRIDGVLQAACPGAQVLPTLAVSASASLESEVKGWLERLGL